MKAYKIKSTYSVQKKKLSQKQVLSCESII